MTRRTDEMVQLVCSPALGDRLERELAARVDVDDAGNRWVLVERGFDIRAGRPAIVFDALDFMDVVRLLVGVALQLPAPAGTAVPDRALTVLACGAVGLVIGAVTEWLTSLLPIRIARTTVYFLINNLIAVVVSVVVTVVLVALTSADVLDRGGAGPIVILVVAIVCVANLGDYLVYRRAQRRLHAIQATLLVTTEDDATM